MFRTRILIQKHQIVELERVLESFKILFENALQLYDLLFLYENPYAKTKKANRRVGNASLRFGVLE